MSIEICRYAESCEVYHTFNGASENEKSVIRKDKREGHYCLALEEAKANGRGPDERCFEGFLDRLNLEDWGVQFN